MESGSDCCKTCHPDDDNRRAWLKGGVSACSVALLAWVGCGPEVAQAALTQAQRDALTPDQIIELMKKGNERFRSGRMKPQDFLAQKRASASGQYPAAIILSCIDSRAPAEIILDIGIGDTFNARVAGNVSNPDMLGSMEFACAVAGAKVILVMGHTACGAIKGAIDNVQLGNLTGLLDSIKPAIEATQYEGERTSKNAGFVDAVAQSNIRYTISAIRNNSSVLADLEKNGKIRIVGAMYDLNNGKVSFMSWPVDPPKILASRAVSLFRHTTARAALLGSALAYGQEMEPRTFSAVPVGTNFVALGYGRSSGGFSAIADVQVSLLVRQLQVALLTFPHGYPGASCAASYAHSQADAVDSANATAD